MNGIKILATIAVLALTTLACTFTIDNQIKSVTVGSLETKDVEVPESDTDQISRIVFEFGAGELNLNPGAQNGLISGTATYNVAEFEPSVTIDGNRVKVSQQVKDVNLIPILDDQLENRWDLQFGTSPMELDISAGGYKGDFELGGLSLHELRIAEGAADTSLSFSELNPVEMDILRYDTGASRAVLNGLANANFREFDFRSGAGEYQLDFSGQLQQDAEVSIKSGLSSIVIIVPEDTRATVRFEGGLANINRSGAWERSGGGYIMPGEGPELNITIEMGAGNLELRDR